MMAETITARGIREAAHRISEKVSQSAEEAEQKLKEKVEQCESRVEAARRQMEKHAFPIAAGLAAGSILFSLALFGKKSKDNAVFVGLWAPTLLSLGIFYMLVGPGKSGSPEE